MDKVHYTRRLLIWCVNFLRHPTNASNSLSTRPSNQVLIFKSSLTGGNGLNLRTIFIDVLSELIPNQACYVSGCRGDEAHFSESPLITHPLWPSSEHTAIRRNFFLDILYKREPQLSSMTDMPPMPRHTQRKTCRTCPRPASSYRVQIKSKRSHYCSQDCVDSFLWGHPVGNKCNPSQTNTMVSF